MTSTDGSRIVCIVCLEHAGRGPCKSSCSAQPLGTVRNSYGTCLAGKLALRKRILAVEDIYCSPKGLRAVRAHRKPPRGLVSTKVEISPILQGYIGHALLDLSNLEANPWIPALLTRAMNELLQLQMLPCILWGVDVAMQRLYHNHRLSSSLLLLNDDDAFKIWTGSQWKDLSSQKCQLCIIMPSVPSAGKKGKG